MITPTLNTKDLFISIADTESEITGLVSSASERELNIVPFKDSWTAAQVSVHVSKSVASIAKLLSREGKEVERDPAEGKEKLKKMFLDFTTKFKSPEFILPTENIYSKETVISDLQNSFESLNEESKKTDLIMAINQSPFGEITKLELLYFVLYHSKRHIHQLRDILHLISNK